jgi:hypothetical protein
MTYKILFVNPNMKKAVAVLKPLDSMAFRTWSQYICQREFEPNDPGRYSVLSNPGVDGLGDGGEAISPASK